MKYGPIPIPHNPADFDIVADTMLELMNVINLPEFLKVYVNVDFANTWAGDLIYSIPIQNKFIAFNNHKVNAKKLYKHSDIVTQRTNCFVFHCFDNVHIDGLRLIGCQGEILDQNYSRGMIGGIKVEGVNFKLTNSVISKTGYMGVLLEHAPEAIIEHNTFSNIRESGWGYCVWQRSKGDNLYHNAFVRYNRFLNFRHCIDGSGQANGFHFTDNLIYGNSSNSPVARHNNDSHQGGAGDVIKNNWFCDRSRPFSLQEVVG